MIIDRKGMRPCSRCLKLRAGLTDTLGKLLPMFKPGFVDLDIRYDGDKHEGLKNCLVRMRLDTGAVVVLTPDDPEQYRHWRKMLDGKHVIFERDPAAATAKLKDRVTLGYYPVTVVASKIVDLETGKTLSVQDDPT